LNIDDSKYVTTGDQFLEYAQYKLPNEIVFIDGEYISFEFAHFALLWQALKLPFYIKVSNLWNTLILT
jgi:hypothetical protein